ncbi:hypothetical protein NE865_05790 [Phthorimaea operculella]|nr:hypothetical protein NE865_05790 [Phthorimaea operculella]
MGDTVLRCPLCCERTFDSKPELVEHLSLIFDSISCPICSTKWQSISHLIDHLTLDNCQADNAVPTLSFDIKTQPENHLNEIENSNQTLENEQSFIEHEPQKDLSAALPNVNTTIDDGSDTGKMYVEFLSKQLTKPCLQTQELKLVKDDGGVRYVFVTNEDENANPGMDISNAVVTKQNNDGTISLTTIQDMKMESVDQEMQDPLMSQEPEPEPQEVEETHEEIYSCNTCGVSFTSVLDHIQNYHNDQDVVVEEPMDDMENGANEFISADMQNQAESILPTTDDVVRQSGRRMITDTGDIIEAPMVTSVTSLGVQKQLVLHPQVKQELVVDKKGQVLAPRRYVVVDSVVKEIKKPTGQVGPYHKVVIKEMTRPSGERIKIFNCMSCHIYVSSLEDFKSRPCRNLRYSCTHCSVSYENSKSLSAHMKVHKAKPPSAVVKTPSQFECDLCNTVFPTNKSLKLHTRMHDPIKRRKIEPPVETADGQEVSGDKFLCSICNRLIPIDYRAVHQKAHKGGTGLNCAICNKEFFSQEYLEMHMTVHLNEKTLESKKDSSSLPYSCLYCERRFSRPHEKVKHERIHTGERPHSCEICGKSFRVSYCLTLHMRTHTGARPYSCKHCGKRFKAHSVYNHHLLTHSEVRAYKCPYCPKAFKTSVQLAGHKNSHTKPFSCQQCNRCSYLKLPVPNEVFGAASEHKDLHICGPTQLTLAFISLRVQSPPANVFGSARVQVSVLPQSVQDIRAARGA